MNRITVVRRSPQKLSKDLPLEDMIDVCRDLVFFVSWDLSLSLFMPFDKHKKGTGYDAVNGSDSKKDAITISARAIPRANLK